MPSAPLNAIRVFAVAARQLSFKKAAAELCVTPGAVSRQVQGLEDYLGIALFERRFREISLTQAGGLYLAQVAPALEAIDRASQRLRDLARGASRQVVQVDATATFAMHWLIPRLTGFHAAHPGVEIRLTTSQGVIDKSRPADLHIRRDPAHFNGLAGIPFMAEQSQLVCSPRLAGHEKLDSPEALLHAPLIAMRSRPDLWPRWFGEHPLRETDTQPRLQLDNTILAIQAVVEGLGVGLIPGLFLSGLMHSGALLSLPNSRPLISGAYHLLHRQAKPGQAARTFADWLVDQGCQETAALEAGCLSLHDIRQARQ